MPRSPSPAARVDAPPLPLGADGIPELTADPEGLLDVQEKIRVALRNVDKVIADNEVAVKDTLRNFETFTASLSGNGENDHRASFDAAETGVTAVDDTPGQDARTSSAVSAATNMAANCCRP